MYGGTLDCLCDTARSRQNERVTYWHPLAAPLLRFFLTLGHFSAFPHCGRCLMR
jgi:hypothetical protein